MKPILFFVFAFLATQFVSAQIGIGTATPNPRAALDISSTTKGLLIPSMTSVQRAFITSPPNGLMVYDTDVNQFYHYDGTNWRKIINSTYWNQSTTRSWVYNSTDSVGIGTSIPAHRLDVNGNIRSRDDVLADGSMIATGIVSGSALQTPGNLTANGTSFLNGDVSTNGDINMNGTGATIQLKPGGVNKGYFQTAGSDVRMGTNSGNSTGNLTIRMNGNDRVVVNAAGDMNVDGKITRPTTGTPNLLPICYGKIGSDGTVISGTQNFSVEKSGNAYHITCLAFTWNTVLVVTPNGAGSGNQFVFAYCSLLPGPTIKYQVLMINTSDFVHPAPFSFVAYQPD